MAKFTKEMVLDYADKLLIGLTEEEMNMVLDEFEVIDNNINIINNIPNINEVEPMSFCLDDFEGVLRDDVIEESVPVCELLQNCNDTSGNEIKVPKVVE